MGRSYCAFFCNDQRNSPSGLLQKNHKAGSTGQRNAEADNRSAEVLNMALTGRPGLSSPQRAELWRRWKAGESLTLIGQALQRNCSSIHHVVKVRGGVAPVSRSRSLRALTLGRTRGDFARRCGWVVSSGNRSGDRESTIVRQSRTRKEWRAGWVSRSRSRGSSMDSWMSTKKMSACRQSQALCYCGSQVEVAMVTGTDRGVA
jgi:hypothetical protein